MNDEKLVEFMGEARLIAASENVIYPMIDLKIKNKIESACSKFRGGSLDFVSDIAYITALRDIEMDLRSKQAMGNKAIKTLHEKTKE